MHLDRLAFAVVIYVEILRERHPVELRGIQTAIARVKPWLNVLSLPGTAILAVLGLALAWLIFSFISRVEVLNDIGWLDWRCIVVTTLEEVKV